MVSEPGLPAITWEEDFGPDDASAMSAVITATITARLKPPASGRERLFFVVPTPRPYAKAEAALLAEFGTGGADAGDLRVVTLPRGGRCYVTADERQFRALLPLAFGLGPPELTLLVANCAFDLTAPEVDIVAFVLATLGDVPSVSRDVAGMHFDSGDLVELL